MIENDTEESPMAYIKGLTELYNNAPCGSTGPLTRTKTCELSSKRGRHLTIEKFYHTSECDHRSTTRQCISLVTLQLLILIPPTIMTAMRSHSSSYVSEITFTHLTTYTQWYQILVSSLSINLLMRHNTRAHNKWACPYRQRKSFWRYDARCNRAPSSRRSGRGHWE